MDKLIGQLILHDQRIRMRKVKCQPGLNELAPLQKVIITGVAIASKAGVLHIPGRIMIVGDRCAFHQMRNPIVIATIWLAAIHKATNRANFDAHGTQGTREYNGQNDGYYSHALILFFIVVQLLKSSHLLSSHLFT